MSVTQRTFTANTSTYVLALNSGEPGIILCDTALYLAGSAGAGAGEATSLPANTRHPHSGVGKLFVKSATGTPTVHVFAG